MLGIIVIMTTILLIDDDRMITSPLRRTLEQNRYTVLVADNGRIGLETALKAKPDVVVLDVMMPEMDGWAVCRQLRQQSGVPILMLTALGEEVDRILGLELGADDYLVKPFSSRELMARIKAMLRRVAIERAETERSIIELGNLKLDLDQHQLYQNGRPLTLRHKEFELLSLLMAHAGEVVTRAVIFDEVWGTDWLGDTRTLDVHIRWLREKIELNPSRPKMIQTVRGVGYRFAASNI